MSTYKLTSRTWNGTLSSPQHQIAYSTIGSPAVAAERSRELRSRLLAGGDCIIELDTALLCAPERERPALAERFREKLSAAGLEVTERRSSVAAKQGFFAKLLGNGGSTEQIELRCLVPAALIGTDAVEAALNPYGLRYYLLPAGADGRALFERMNFGTLPERERLDTLPLVIFDVAAFGQMGLVSTLLDAAAIEARANGAGRAG